MGLRARMRRLERAAEEEMVVIPQQDGTVRRFPADVVFPEAFLHETGRWKAAHRGEPVPERHPLIDALRKAKDPGLVEAIANEHGSVVSLMLGEDRIASGEVSREQAIAEMRRARRLEGGRERYGN
jgi:hypothetical protein